MEFFTFFVVKEHSPDIGPAFWIVDITLDHVKRIWYLSPMRAAKVQASLRIRAVSPEPSLLAHTSSESRGTFRQKARSLAPLNGWACAVSLSWRNARRHKFAWRGSPWRWFACTCALTFWYIFASSAKNLKQQSLTPGRSLTYIKNNIWPNTLPCGFQSDKLSPIVTSTYLLLPILEKVLYPQGLL